MYIYICGSTIKYSEFPDEFWKELDKLMAKGEEILLGTSDFAHRVYGRCRNKQYENVSIIGESTKTRRSLSFIESALPSYVCMLRKCDRMITVWDGESSDAFINIMLLLSLHKKCRMYYLPTNECVEIGSVGEFKPYVQEREGWTVSDMEEVLRKCGFEEQMVVYTLESGLLPETLVTEIISRAPVPLNKKLEMLEKLQKKNDQNYKAFCKVSELIWKDADFELVKQEILDIFSLGAYISKGIHDIKLAKYWLKHGIYYLFAERYDTDMFIEKSCPIGMFRSFLNAMKRIEHDERFDCEGSGDEPLADWWYRLEVWIEDYGSWGSDNKHEYNFYIYKGKVCWFERLREEKEADGVSSFMPENKDFFGGMLDLNMPTPFKIGDIVNIDCTPFGPPFHALIIEAKHQQDSCMPQVLFKIPFTDKWTTASLKQKQFYKDAELHHYEPVLSPLYRLRTVRKYELTEDDDLLIRISKDLKDEETGCSFGRELKEGLSAEEVLKIWESVSKIE